MECTLCRTPDAELLHRDDEWRYYRCRECALVFGDPAAYPGREEERARYETHNNDPRDPAYRNFLSRLTAPLMQHLAPGMEGMDYGSGPGPAISAMLGEAGLRVTNYDPIFAPDARALEKSYDFITCTETAEHFHDPGAEFERLASLLRPGGILAVMTGMIEDDAGFGDWWYRLDPTHVCFYRKATMRWIANRYGWRVRFPAPNVTLFFDGRG